MILGALHDAGGQRYLTQQARENPTAFLTLLGKVLPTTVNPTIKREVSEYTEDELRAIIAAGKGEHIASRAATRQAACKVAVLTGRSG
jgi:hypothetical protein